MHVYRKAVGTLMAKNRLAWEPFYNENIINCFTNIKRTSYKAELKVDRNVCTMNIKSIDLKWYLKNPSVNSIVGIFVPDQEAASSVQCSQKFANIRSWMPY